MKFIVFGLGNYGASLAHKLVTFGHEVIGVDNKLELVEKWKNHVTHTIAMDATSPEAMKSLPLKDVDVVINSIGENEGTNIMVTALLKQLGVGRIICRVTSPLQKTVLEAMDIREFVSPESDSAERMAYKLDLKGVIDSFKITDNYQLIEVAVPERYIDNRISEIPFLEKYEVQPVTLLRPGEEKNIFGTSRRMKHVLGVLTPETVLKKGDSLLLFGDVDKLERFVED
jgi:trk system potassium uptake protein TrkA